MLRFVRGVHQLATTPNATLRVTGASTKKLIVRTNMETYSAQLQARDGAGASYSDAEVATWAAEKSNGDLDIAVQAHTATISVPASFNVSVDMQGACDVNMEGGWKAPMTIIDSQKPATDQPPCCDGK